jgi:glycosyltransferase involved in cell wall biosynthesis
MAETVNTPMVTVLHTPPFYELELAIGAAKPNPRIDFVTVSAKNAQNWNKYVDDCAVISNGISLSEWEFYEESAKDSYAFWFGRIHPDKGLHLAIVAARKAGIRLRIAGGIADQKYYEKEIVPLLGEDTELLGLLDQKELNREIGQASVCLITPCWEEPFGLVVAEAMACGTPVAGFRMGALPELISIETGVLTDFGDTDGLAEAIKHVTQLNRKTVRDYADSNFSDEQMIGAYEQLLEKSSLKKRTLRYAI